MKIPINWKEPKTELDHYQLSALLWYDIYKNKYCNKEQSKYFIFVEKQQCFTCSLCNCFNQECEKCVLQCFKEDSLYYLWLAYANDQAAKAIYKICIANSRRILKAIKSFTLIKDIGCLHLKRLKEEADSITLKETRIYFSNNAVYIKYLDKFYLCKSLDYKDLEYEAKIILNNFKIYLTYA